MSVTKVFALSGGHDYEGNSILEVFASAESAQAALAKIQAHKAKQPRCPQDDVMNPANDPIFDKWRKADAKWRKGLYNGSDYDSYWLTEHEVSP